MSRHLKTVSSLLPNPFLKCTVFKRSLSELNVNIIIIWFHLDIQKALNQIITFSDADASSFEYNLLYFKMVKCCKSLSHER